MITSYGNITVLSSDRSLIGFLRKISPERKLRDSQLPEILLIDQRDIKQLKKIHSKYQSSNITKIYITEDVSYDNLSSLLNENDSYILCHPFNRNFLKCLIDKINRERKLVKYKDLELDLINNSLRYRGCKISLNYKESLILKIVIKVDGFALTEHIIQEAGEIFDSSRDINRVISTINRKYYQSFRTKLLVNRYGKGYYIDI